MVLEKEALEEEQQDDELDAIEEDSSDAEVRDLQVRCWFKLEHALLYKYRLMVFKPLCAASG